MAIELKDTLNLPETDFPMRANLNEREPQRIAHWDQTELYAKIQDKNKDKKAYILHDGPPFTNGDVHIGTALNKILKDTILRYKSMRGFRTPYVPGWDCHGLPIEHKVMKELRKDKEDLSPIDIRKACAKFSSNYIEKQRGQFQRLGVLADWKREYKTMDPAYEAEILSTFSAFVKKDLVYRSKKPVYWSIPCATALAESEIEYQDHNSPSIYVKFPLSEADSSRLGASGKTFVVIWTTTPWTLPSNLAIAVHPEMDYQFVEHQGESYLVNAKLADTVIKDCELEGAKKYGNLINGKDLEGIKAQHPFIDRESPMVLATYVTHDGGTGCVHTAPGHGHDDYLTGLKYGLEIYSPLDDNACYIEDGRIPAELIGLAVFDKKGKSRANEGVLAMLKERGMVLHYTRIQHQYPHCWRSKTPVIYRAMDQWFVNLDKGNTREKALKAIKDVTWTPHWGEARITGAVESRPDWCISRQRSWGVPLPAFYDEEGNTLLDAKVIEGIAAKVAKKGTNLWFEASAEELLEGIDLPSKFQGKTLYKGNDTLDVWIDSGSSHQAVLKEYKDLSWPADLYFEGSDQHRGWFQSSLWTGIIACDSPPYKQVITHGFVVNEQKKKISKSDKKPQTADSYVQQYGADILRLWINSEDYRNDIPISEGILKHVVQTYRTIRNTLRFQIGNLYDFNYEKNAIEFKSLTTIDKWALHQTAELIHNVTEAFDSFQFHRAYQYLNKFCAVTLSSIYHDILKDRLYTYAPNWTERRASQTTIHYIFDTLIKLLAPILTFTSDEAYAYKQGNTNYLENSIHLTDWPEAPNEWLNPDLVAEVDIIFSIRDKVNEQLESARKAKLLGQSMDARSILSVPTESKEFLVLKKHEKDLSEWFIVSQVEIKAGSYTESSVQIVHAEGIRCPRSWRWVSELTTAEGYGEVSIRCKEALLEKYSKNPFLTQS